MEGGGCEVGEGKGSVNESHLHRLDDNRPWERLRTSTHFGGCEEDSSSGSVKDRPWAIKLHTDWLQLRCEELTEHSAY